MARVPAPVMVAETVISMNSWVPPPRSRPMAAFLVAPASITSVLTAVVVIAWLTDTCKKRSMMLMFQPSMGRKAEPPGWAAMV